jgi:hypothetical protein
MTNPRIGSFNDTIFDKVHSIIIIMYAYNRLLWQQFIAKWYRDGEKIEIEIEPEIKSLQTLVR